MKPQQNEHSPTSHRRSPVPTRSWALSTHPSGQLVCMSTRTVTHVAWSGPNGVLNALGHSEATRDARGCLRGRGTRMPGSEAAVEWRMWRWVLPKRFFFLINRAAFDTLEKAKRWTAFHVAQTISISYRTIGSGLIL